jgi:alpha-L-arabinofuranosidase
MFGQNSGTHLLNVLLDGDKAIGQQNLYASAVFDENSNEIIVKVVNTNEFDAELKIDIKGQTVSPLVLMETLAYNDLNAVNSIDFPEKISTQKKEISWNRKTKRISLTAQSFSILKFKKN